MKLKKLNIIYDATIIANGISNNAGKSGIYFTALNILKELVKRTDVNLTLYCDIMHYDNLCLMLEKEFYGVNFKILTQYFEIFYMKLRNKKIQLREQKRNILKTFVQLLMLPASLLNKLLSKFEFIYLLRTKEYDAFLSPIYKIPKVVKCKKYVVLYDLIPQLLPKYYNNMFDEGNWLYDLCQTLNNEDYYFTISEATKNDFLKYYPQITPEHVHTTLLACDERFNPADFDAIKRTKQKYDIPIDCRYVFSLCTLEPRKNLIRAVKTFIQFIQKNDIDDMFFVLGGGHWEEFIGKLEQEIENLGSYKDKIIKAGYIDDEDLAPLYSGAEWFVYTSMYEGFGLPPLEAMSCGCPVITSNNSSLPEVVGDAGIMIDWDSDEQHVKAYEKYYFDKELREQNRLKGLERAKQFSWSKCVNQMLEVMYKNKDLK